MKEQLEQAGIEAEKVMQLGYLTSREMAQLHQVSLSTVSRWCRNGDVPTLRVNRTWLIPLAAALSFESRGPNKRNARPGYHILTEKEVAEVRRLSKTMRHSEIARNFGISLSAVTRFVKGERRVPRRPLQQAQDNLTDGGGG